jgi:hypothetical protein
MLFSEVYSAYFNAVAAILCEAVRGEISEKRTERIVRQKAFSDSILAILPALKNGEWQVINCVGKTPIQKPPQMPLTTLQKRWLKALLNDPRIALFAPDTSGLEDVQPLFFHDDIVAFDRYADGDPFDDAAYIRCFHTILTALNEKRGLKIGYKNRRHRHMSGAFVPYKLEYSSKDDKFRLIAGGNGGRTRHTINLAQIVRCEPTDANYDANRGEPKRRETSLEFDLLDERNALERVLLHFSDCRKETRRSDDTRYHVTLWYDPQDEAEMLIRILSFGQMIRVTAPERFVNSMRDRIFKQQKLFEI